MSNLALHFTDSTLGNILQQHKIVLVDFWAPWCTPCIQLGPVIERLAQMYQDKAIIGKLNIDENAQTPTQYAIQTIPTMLLFYEGKQVERMIGNLPQEKIQQTIDQYLV